MSVSLSARQSSPRAVSRLGHAVPRSLDALARCYLRNVLEPATVRADSCSGARSIGPVHSALDRFGAELTPVNAAHPWVKGAAADGAY